MSILDQLFQKREQRVLSAHERYVQLAHDAAADKARDADEAEEILAAAGKAAEDLERVVELLRERGRLQDEVKSEPDLIKRITENRDECAAAKANGQRVVREAEARLNAAFLELERCQAARSYINDCQRRLAYVSKEVDKLLGA